MAQRPIRKPRRGKSRRWPFWLLFIAVILGSGLAIYVAYLDRIVTSRFEGKRWALPAQVYARPLELYPGNTQGQSAVIEELQRLGYRDSESLDTPGTFRSTSGHLEIYIRGFRFWDGQEPSRRIQIRFTGEDIEQIRDAQQQTVNLVRLDPVLIGSIYPRQGEDRILVRLQDVPPKLISTLVQVEDHRFYEHHGLDYWGILRAIVVNLRAGSVVQGGSTLTQQLVKNFFLNDERSLRRKFNEAIMALLLDWHYRKSEILETYLNEVYLGQDGPRAIHGFGLASYFYFQKPVSELQDTEIALLVGLVKGPSYYDPRRSPKRALTRRNLVLDIMAQRQLITPAQAQAERLLPLNVRSHGAGQTRFPAFIDLVRQQLQMDYKAEDLQTEGLRIFTTLDPRTQLAAERAVTDRLSRIEHARKMPAGVLQAAVVIADSANGEILGLVGDRQARYNGFNRALSAQRQIGSLIKPSIYLTALSQPERYHLASMLDDTPFSLKLPNGQLWSPQNYDHTSHGQMPLFLALAQSNNLASVRLGIDLGIGKVIQTLKQLGLEQTPNAYPSLLLGAINLTPLQVAQIYEPLAAGGFSSRLRAIREVMTQAGVPLQHYSLNMNQVVDPKFNYLLVRSMQEVVRQGTASGLNGQLPADLNIAAKTGTTNDYRDSWFAGFSGDRLAVIWVGRDDNQPTGLSGASGAMPIWASLMREIKPQPLNLEPPDGIIMQWIDSRTGLLSAVGCPGAIELPFIEHSGPTQMSACAQPEENSNNPIDWIKRWFQ